MYMRKKICFVVSTPATAKAFLSNHIKELSRFYDVYLVANIAENENILLDLPVIEIKNVPIYRKINIFKDIKSLVLLKKYFSENKFDVVHSVTPKAGLIAMLSAKLAKVKHRIHIFTGQVWHTQSGFMKRLLMFLDKCIVWSATDILVDGASQRHFLIENKIIKESNSKVLGKGSINGVDTDIFVPNINIAKEVREELNIDEDSIVFMFLGRLNKDKGIIDLVDAFIILKKKYANIRLLIIGPDEENIITQIKSKYNELDSIVFYGATSFPYRMLQACDVFCLPSYREGFGTSVIEASLLEKPIICSDTYGLKETIIENKTGLRHKVGDVDSILKAMHFYIYDDKSRILFGRNGRKYVLENFSGKMLVEKWVQFYKELMNDV